MCKKPIYNYIYKEGRVMKEKERFGKLIRDSRENKNMSQEQLAEKCNVTDKSISNIELGKSDPKLSTVMRICNVLEIDVNALTEFTFMEDDDDGDESI